MRNKSNDVPEFNVYVKKKFFPPLSSFLPWIESETGDRYIINKENYKKFNKIKRNFFIGFGGVAMIGIQNFLNFGVDTIHRMEGTSYIVERFEGIVPNGLKSKKLDDDSIELQYTDPNGALQTFSGDSVKYLVDEMTDTTLSNGYPVDWLAVYLDEKCGGHASELLCIDEETINKAKLDAYSFKEVEEKKAKYDAYFSDRDGRVAEYEKQKEEYISKGAKR